MTFAIVKKADGTKVIVPNTAKNAAGSSFTLANAVNDSDGNPFTIFTAEAAVVVPKEIFIVESNRVFMA